LSVALATLLVCAGAARVWRTVQRVPGIDFYQFWVVGQAVGRGDVSSVYADDSRAALGQEFLRRADGPEGSERQRAAARFRQVLEPLATPFLYAALRPFGWGAYDTGLDAFSAFGIAALLAGTFVLCSLAGYATLERLLLLALAVHAFQPVLADVRVGNVNQVQLGLLASFAWLASGSSTPRQLGAGAVLGVAVAFKPTLALVVPVVLAGRALAHGWRRAVSLASGVAAGTLAGLVVGAAFFGSFSAWSDWLSALRAAPLAAMPVDVGNVSPLAVADRWLGAMPGLLPGLVGSLALAAALWRGRRTPPEVTGPDDGVDDLRLVAAGCLLVLVSAPLVWQHYLVLALPAVIVLLRPGRNAGRRWLALAAFVAIAIDPYADLLGITDPARQAPVVVAGLLLLFALVALEIGRQNEAGRKGGDAGPGAPSRSRG
jgi:hypothetical protein